MGKHKSTAQGDILYSFMEAHPDLAKGFAKGDKTTQDMLWAELANQLNACGLPPKDAGTWRKSWTDWKRNIKHKLAHNKAELRTTGGGPYNHHVLTHLEEKIATLCNLYVAVEGVANTKSFCGSRKENVPIFSSGEASAIGEASLEHIPSKGESRPQTPAATNISSPSTSPGTPITSKRTTTNTKRNVADMADVMEEEASNFRMLANKLEGILEAKEQSTKHMESINKNLANIGKQLNEIRSIKRRKLEETKRHNSEVQKLLVEKNQTKLQLLDIEKIKVGMYSN